MVKIIIMVDDINQEIAYQPNQNMLDLINDYGCKFSLFVPAKFKGKELPPDFVSSLINNPNFEICAHGLKHDTNEDGTNAEEFKDLTENEINSKLVNMNQIWNTHGYEPRVVKFPGWTTPLYTYNTLIDLGYYIVVDHMKNDGLIDYHDRENRHIYRIGYDYSIDNLPEVVTKDLLILQSHINSIGGSKNIWNEENTLKFRLWLDTLDNPEFIFFGDLI